MKKFMLLLCAFQFVFIGLLAQTNIPPVDKSPMDMSYYPVNYPVLKINDKITEPLAARVVYSRPQKAGRPKPAPFRAAGGRKSRGIGASLGSFRSSL